MVKSVLGEHIPVIFIYTSIIIAISLKWQKNFQFLQDEKLQEIFASNKSDSITPVKLSFSCLRFLVLNAIKYNADEHTFTTELQQLGLQKDHSTAICKVMVEHSSALKKFLKDTSLTSKIVFCLIRSNIFQISNYFLFFLVHTVNELDGISYTIQKDTVDCALLKIDIKNEIVDGIPMKTIHKINISKSDIPILINELKIISNMMENLDYEKRHNNSGEEEETAVNIEN